MKKSILSVQTLAEIAIFAALSFGLDALQGGYSRGMFVNGGSIGIAMLPIFVLAYRRGLIPGLICGFIVSLISLIGAPYIINAANYNTEFLNVMGPFFMIMLDYILGYTLVGLAGAFSGLYAKGKTKGQRVLWVVVGTVMAGLLKYASHVISGALFWLNPSITFLGVNGGSVLYSFVYNGAYCIPNIIITTSVMVILAAFYPGFLTVKTREEAAAHEEAEEALKEEPSHE